MTPPPSGRPGDRVASRPTGRPAGRPAGQPTGRRRRTVALAVGAALGITTAGAATASADASPAHATKGSWLPRQHAALVRAATVGQPHATRPAPRLSPNATSPVVESAIVYVEYNVNAGIAIKLRRYDVNGAPVTETILPSQTSYDYEDPVISPDGTKVAFAQQPIVGGNVTGTPQIAVVSVAGGTVTPLHPSSHFQCAPDWHDPTHILYTEDCAPSGSPSLVLADTSGGTPTTILTAAAVGHYNDDRSKIAYMHVTSTSSTVATADADGSNSFDTRITGTYPELSADNTRIVYEYAKSQFVDGIAVMNADGTSAKALPAAAPPDVDATSPSWSDTGTEIYYSAAQVDPTTGNETTNYEIFSVDSTGTYAANLTLTGPDIDEVPARFFGHIAPRLHGSLTTFTPIVPRRILDTRSSTKVGSCVSPKVGTAGIPADTSCRLTISGSDVPTDVRAVVLNVTGISPTSNTYLSVYPTSTSSVPPLVSNLNLVAHQTAAVLVQVRLGNTNQVTIYNKAGNTHVAVDVSGYFTGDSTQDTYHALSPTRIVDTRPTGHVGTCSTLHANESCLVNVSAPPSTVPANASAVVLNLTGISPTSGTYVKVYSSGGTPPVVSNLNLSAHVTRANLVTVKVGTGDGIVLYNNAGTIDLAVDVAGYYTADGTGAAFFPAPTPVRILDTRYKVKTPLLSSAPLAGGRPVNALASGTITTHDGLAFLPASPTAIVFNLTGVAPTSSTYLSAYPSTATAPPLVSNVNLPQGQTVPNLDIASVPSATGQLKLYNNRGNTAALMDFFGYYNPLH